MKLIERNSKILGGTPVLAGTRIPIYVLLSFVAGEESIENVAAMYEINPRTIYDLLLEIAMEYNNK